MEIFVWAGVFVFLNNAAWTWYFAENKQSVANVRLLIGLGINIVLNYVLIPLYGIYGAAVATLFSRVVVAYVGQLFNKDSRVLFFMMSKSLLWVNAYEYFKKNNIKL